ncbi:MAG: hypothetical protein OXI57_06170 [Rhodospirillales bacterium]|nr:hypothetical protein [Rhodospirillales bacterium]
MRRFLRDAAVALFVGAVLIALAMVLNAPSDDPPEAGPAPAQEAPKG